MSQIFPRQRVALLTSRPLLPDNWTFRVAGHPWTLNSFATAALDSELWFAPDNCHFTTSSLGFDEMGDADLLINALQSLHISRF